MNKLRLIQCGVGGFGAGWLANHTTKSPDFELVAIVDVKAEALAKARQTSNLAEDRCFSTLEEAVRRVQADAVLTVTPPAVHVEHARIAFENGLHLMSEKPMADSLVSARDMVEMARRAGRQLVVSQNYRYSKQIQKLRQLVESRSAGELGHGHVDFYIPADFSGSFRENMQYVLLVDMAIHHLDLIRFISGRNIVKVFAQTFRPAWSWYGHHSGVKLLMELDGGLPFSYSGDWSAYGRPTSWNGDWRLQCSQGALHLTGTEIAQSTCERWAKEVRTVKVEADEIEHPGQAGTLRAFANAIRTGRPAPTGGDDNIWSLGAVMAGIRSTQTGQPVDVCGLIRGE